MDGKKISTFTNKGDKIKTIIKLLDFIIGFCKMKQLQIITILIFVFSYSIYGQNTESNKAKAQEILAKAKEAISTKRKTEDVKGLSIAWVITARLSLSLRSGQPVEIDNAVKSESHFELQNLKIREKVITDQTDRVGNRTSSSQVVEESVLNGDSFSYNRGDFVEGEKVMIAVPTLSKEEGIALLKKDTFPKLFPVTLNSWYLPLDFYYIGIAESNDGRANIIEAISNDATTYRLFFDEKTNLLLMMTRTFTNKENQKTEQKYYY